MREHKFFRALWSIGLVVMLLAACQATPTAEPTAAPTTVMPPTAVAQVPATAVPPTSAPTPVPAAQDLILATTTSTADSGLLDYLLPDFEKAYQVKIKVIAVGTGQALQTGMDGNADVLMVHARAKEDAFMKDGHGARR